MRLIKRSTTGGIEFTKDLSDEDLQSYPYAILSHTWSSDEEEVTYEEFLADRGASKQTVGLEKIKLCIERSKHDKLQYFWLDTCCINKKDMLELSKALNSMFRWYANARKCYVYLTDVSAAPTDSQEHWEHSFKNSRWMKRGWTLQELIAPSMVEFYGLNGIYLGNKSSLGSLLHASTRIPVKALQNYSPTYFTISERKEWQQGRTTKEPEDMVYSMLGLLEVSLHIDYGITKAEAERRLDVALATKYKGA